MNARLFAVVLCVGAIAHPGASAAEWVVKLDVTTRKTTTDANGKNPPKVEDFHYAETVALHPDYVVVQDEERKITYDFTRRRMVTLTLATNRYVDASLYPTAAFLEHELVNRNVLNSAFRAAKVEEAAQPFDRFWSETMLRTESRQTPPGMPVPKIEIVEAGGAKEFRHDGALVVRFSAGPEKLPADLQHRFANFLAYHCDLHPQIRQAIVATGAPPRELSYEAHNLNVTAFTTLRLISSAAGNSDSSALPAGAQPTAPDTGRPLDAVLAGVSAVASKPARPALKDTVKFADSAISSHRPLDALLAFLEYSLVTGEQPAAEMRKHQVVFSNDAACQAYLKAFADSSKEIAGQSLKLNESFDRKNLQKAYMLDVQRANLLERVGRQPEAIALFHSVLRTNPYHTGGLHDLGKMYAMGYEEFSAWRCWDLARQLYPNHPMMQDIALFERMLVTRQADFF